MYSTRKSCLTSQMFYLSNLIFMYINLFGIRLVFQNSLIAESLFRVFDEDNSGNLNFFEFLQGTSTIINICPSQ